MPHPAVSTPKQSAFLVIPDAPLVYWLRPKFFELLQGRRLGDVATVARGLDTSDLLRFGRCLWENKLSTERWRAFHRGGGYGKWVGLDWANVDWQYKGKRILASPGSAVRNQQLYFKSVFVYSFTARGSLGVRQVQSSGIFAGGFASAIASDITIPGLLALLNTRMSSFAVRSISAKIQLTESYVTRIPFPASIPAVLPELERACITLKRHLVACDPTERSFTGVISDQGALEAIAALLHTLEGINEAEVFAAYGVAGDDMRAVLEETGVPAGFHPLLAGYDALPDISTDSTDTTDKTAIDLSGIRAIRVIRGTAGYDALPEVATDSTDTTDKTAIDLSGIRAIRAIRAIRGSIEADADGIIPLVHLGTGEATLAERLPPSACVPVCAPRMAKAGHSAPSIC